MAPHSQRSSVTREGGHETPGRSESALVIMFFICARKNLIDDGLTSEASMSRCTRWRSSRELTQLLGTASTCRKEPRESVTSSSHSFFPSAPCTGRE